MGAVLTEFEDGARFVGDHAAVIASLHQRLERIQLAQIAASTRSIVLFEGWEASGRKQALRRLAAAWDPCHFTAHCTLTRGFGDSRRHWLMPYWSNVPAAGDSALYYRGWYDGMAEARAFDQIDGLRWARALDEINEFEAQQADHDTVLVKLFFHIGADAQARRLRERALDPWPSSANAASDRLLESRAAHSRAWEDVFEQTDTRWAPWRIIDAADEKAAQVAALTAVADAMEKARSRKPPARARKISAMPERVTV